MATVLIVEGDASVVRALRKHLEKIGHTVRDVSSGEAAITALAADIDGDIDVLICDLGLSGMSGVAVIEAARAEARTHHLPIIAVCHGELQSHALALDAGADVFLDKPIKLTALDAELSRLLSEKGA